MSYNVEYTSKARRDLKNLPLDIAQNIIRSINIIKNEPYYYVKKIKGTKNYPLYTHRIGEYRVILDIEDKRLLIIVIEAGHRSKIYRNYWCYLKCQIEENDPEHVENRTIGEY